MTLTAVGLAGFLVASDPSESVVAGRTHLQVGLTAACAAVALAVIVGARRVRAGHYRAFLLGAGAGILFGLVAVTLKVAVHDLATAGVGGCSRPGPSGACWRSAWAG
ncbi:MAG: hypothetical protein R2731_01890 [Nocardioides sp.]